LRSKPTAYLIMAIEVGY